MRSRNADALLGRGFRGGALDGGGGSPSPAGGLGVLGWSAAGGRVLVSYATVGTVGFALAALGAWFGSIWSDPLDAAALSVGSALVAAFGIFAAGPLAANLPTAVVNAALMASPIVSAASAADVDLLRTDLLYRISPLAHGRFDYPSWFAPLAVYGTLLLISLAGTARALRKGWL